MNENESKSLEADNDIITSPSIRDAASPKLSGKKRIRQSLDQQTGAGDSSDPGPNILDEKDFLGSSATAKVTKRVIFDNDDE